MHPQATTLERERECRNRVRERLLCRGDVGFVTWRCSSYTVCRAALSATPRPPSAATPAWTARRPWRSRSEDAKTSSPVRPRIDSVLWPLSRLFLTLDVSNLKKAFIPCMAIGHICAMNSGEWYVIQSNPALRFSPL